MNNFGKYVTPEQAAKEHNDLNPHMLVTVEEMTRRSKIRKRCEVCGDELVWRLVDTGMCFSCTTGEWDASDDTELLPRE